MTQTLAALSIEELEATLVILVLTLVILLPILFMLSFMLFIYASIPDKANEKSAGTVLLFSDLTLVPVMSFILEWMSTIFVLILPKLSYMLFIFASIPAMSLENYAEFVLLSSELTLFPVMPFMFEWMSAIPVLILFMFWLMLFSFMSIPVISVENS